MERNDIIHRTKDLPIRNYGDDHSEKFEAWERDLGNVRFTFSARELLVPGCEQYTLSVNYSDLHEMFCVVNAFEEVFGEPMDIVFQDEATHFNWLSFQINEVLEGEK